MYFSSSTWSKNRIGFSRFLNNKRNQIYGNLIPDRVWDCYNESHRHWHNEDHLISVVKDCINNYPIDTGIVENHALFIAAVYHDIVYSPTSKNNEERSVELMKEILKDNPNSITNQQVIEKAAELILKTKTNEDTILNRIDRSVLTNGSVADILRYSSLVRKEFNIYGWNAFKAAHKEIVMRINKNLSWYCDYIDSLKPTLGLYAGSFNPFHIGHKHIADEANKIFDKVILAKGINPEKVNVEDLSKRSGLPYSDRSTHGNYQVITFGTLLSHLVESLSEYDVTIIRGARNGNDFDYGTNQDYFLKELNKNLKIAYIGCPLELSKISSSAIRTLNAAGSPASSELASKYIWKDEIN